MRNIYLVLFVIAIAAAAILLLNASINSLTGTWTIYCLVTGVGLLYIYRHRFTGITMGITNRLTTGFTNGLIGDIGSQPQLAVEQQSSETLAEFDQEFEPFVRFNPKAIAEARRTLIAFLNLQGVVESHQLYTNAAHMRRECLNALQSIIISIDDRQYIDSLEDRITKLSDRLNQALEVYRGHIATLPISTTWLPLEDPSHPVPLNLNDGAHGGLDYSVAAYDWHA